MQGHGKLITPFVEYIGEWDQNKRHGKGTEKGSKTGMEYDGDWV